MLSGWKRKGRLDAKGCVSKGGVAYVVPSNTEIYKTDEKSFPEILAGERKCLKIGNTVGEVKYCSCSKSVNTRYTARVVEEETW